MEENIKAKDKTHAVDESELEAVTGGEVDDEGDLCHFVPTNPVEHNSKKDGVLWVKCGSYCSHVVGTCMCHGTDFCINKWHQMEHVGGDIWSPKNMLEYNHMASSKAVRDSSIPY